MAKIIRMTTVVRDGMHNAFTDLQLWQGNYWVAYRKGAGHRSMDGEATISVSFDRQRFREVAHLHVPGDNRDPKLLPLDDSLMAGYFPGWPEGVEPRKLQQFIAFSRNGYDWDEPQPILEPAKILEGFHNRGQNGRLWVELRFLGHHRPGNAVSDGGDCTFVGYHPAGHDAQQGRLAGTVRTHDSETIPLRYVEGYSRKHGYAVEILGDISDAKLYQCCPPKARIKSGAPPRGLLANPLSPTPGVFLPPHRLGFYPLPDI